MATPNDQGTPLMLFVIDCTLRLSGYYMKHDPDLHPSCRMFDFTPPLEIEKFHQLDEELV